MTEEPDTSDESSARAKASKRMAWLLDECIRIPGTNIKFGLDPIMGMIPGGGEFVATMAGATVLGEAGKKGIPFGTLVRMGGNMLLNALVGIVPGLGDLFSFWFKSNKRNYEMLNEFLDSDEGKEAEGGWWPILMVGIIIGAVLLVNLAVLIAIGITAKWVFNNSGMFVPPS
ncbi:MAG: DUF4112 domain-containing protein [Verrucomicrobiales bacterium]|nr:DUF4112 domain-containing protein [Verrucomicrobiales bacterium]